MLSTVLNFILELFFAVQPSVRFWSYTDLVNIPNYRILKRLYFHVGWSCWTLDDIRFCQCECRREVMESGSSRETTAAELQAPYGSAGNKYAHSGAPGVLLQLYQVCFIHHTELAGVQKGRYHPTVVRCIRRQFKTVLATPQKTTSCQCGWSWLMSVSLTEKYSVLQSCGRLSGSTQHKGR